MDSPFIKKLRYFRPVEHYSDGWSELSAQGQEWEKAYRQRWQYDKFVRTTHGVNCTGSCSWRVFVKDGIITWENQATDYPTTGPDIPEFEPRGCPRGASYSWYVYSPLRIKYPYVRGVLWQMWQDALREKHDPVTAWESLVEDPVKSKSYKAARGKGGFVRVTWAEVNQLIAAAMIHTIKKYGPDRIAGVSPIPAMSMVSYAGGSRFLSLVGAPMLSFYDWYADLPPASPQIWGEQTEVPESSDWFNAGYLIMWGSNVPMTRTPDAHFMTEVRYKGTKVVSVSPDYAQNTKFADNWLNVKPGSDGALAQAMTHVILQEFYVEHPTDYFLRYAKQFTDLPYLIMLATKDNTLVADRFLTAQDLGMATNKPEWKPLVWNSLSQQSAIPKGSVGHRWGEPEKWNLKLQDEQGNELDPALSLLGIEDERAIVDFPCFAETPTSLVKRAVPVKKIQSNGQTIQVTTVYDLMLAQYGVSRGMPGEYPVNYDDLQPHTPAWQEQFTGVSRQLVIQIAREFARNAADTNGRSMIIMGAGINHWYNGDATYRAILNLVLLTGAQGVNGGGWAHYVGQEKCRPLEGWQTVAFARDWSAPPRLQNATSYYYFATGQWRYDNMDMSTLTPPNTSPRYRHAADYNVLAARLGWLPSYPQFNRNSLNLYAEAQAAGAQTPEDAIQYVVNQLKAGSMHLAAEDPDNPQNFPRAMFVWRSNLLSSSGKGHEYFLKYLLGTSHGLLAEENPTFRPTEITWREKSPEGKLDLLVTLDFRMADTPLYSDVVLPAATWYEKYDLNSTDMHPFIHPFNPAVSPSWESKPDWDIFKDLADAFSELAKTHLPAPQSDIVTTALLHDSADETAQPFGKVLDWRKGECEPIPGKTMPKISIVERDYTQIHAKFIALGGLLQTNPIGAHGIPFPVNEQYEQLKKLNGPIEQSGVAQGLPSLLTDRNACEAILTLSSSTNGAVAVKAWESLERQTGLELKHLVKDRAEEHLTFANITIQPRLVLSTPIFSGTTTGTRRYTAFSTNIENLVPFRTLTGRQHFYLDHEVFLEFGEGLPVFKPPLPQITFADWDKRPAPDGKEITLRYLTPHGKWNFHSTYQDNLTMLTLFRGGPNVWLNNKDAEAADIKDNDWLEIFNRNGVVVARAVVSHRMPCGTMFMYHAQDKHLNSPGSKISGERGGVHNSPTRIHLKPTQMAGGYAQLSYGFNYYGPIGNQRDLYVVVRKLKEVAWLED